MRLLFIVCCVCLSTSVFCQECAVIKDDGYTLIHRHPDTKSTIVGRIFDDDIFICSKDSVAGDWYRVYYEWRISNMTKNQKSYYLKDARNDTSRVVITGYVHKSHVVTMKSWHKVIGRNTSTNCCVLSLKNDSLSLQISTQKFEASNHRVKWCGSTVCGIDGHGVVIASSKTPMTEVTDVRMWVDSTEIVFPKSQFNDLYELNLSNVEIYADDKGKLFVISSNGDGSGHYEAIWLIRNHKYLRRKIIRG